MALPLSQNAQARALLRHLLEHGDTLGMDIAEGTIIQLALHDRALERFLTFDAAAAEWRTGTPSTRSGPPALAEHSTAMTGMSRRLRPAPRLRRVKIDALEAPGF